MITVAHTILPGSGQIEARSDDAFVGMILWERREDHLKVTRLYVDESHPRALSLMMARMRSKCAPTRLLFDVASTNERMQRLAGLLGAEEVGRIYSFDLARAGSEAE
jgi:hypothetical protein